MCGTCLMVNNKYETFSSKDIADAAERSAKPVYANGCPTSALQLLLKVSNNDINLRDIAKKKSEEKWSESLIGIDTDKCTQEPPSMPKTKYTKEQKKLRSITFPCSYCNEPADGSHQCGYCYCHLHAM